MEPRQLPPNVFLRFFRWYCHPKLADHIEGDLLEVYLQRKARLGKRKADLFFIRDVLLLVRPGIIRPAEGTQRLNTYGIYSNYVTVSGRNLMRNKLFSIINIFGLALSMTVGLMLIGVLYDTYAYDRFHRNYDRIYRVLSRYQYLEHKDDQFYASTSMKAAMEIEESFPGHEGLAILHRGFDGDLKHGETTVPTKGFLANNNFFQVFDFPLVKGNAATALKEPFSVVITEQTAARLMGDKDPLGEILVLNNKRSYTITGVLKDIIEFSHMRFDALASLTPEALQEKDGSYALSWENMWNTWVYVLMPESPDLSAFQANLDNLSAKEDPTVKNVHISLKLQALRDVMVGEDLNNQIGATVGRTMMWSFLGLAIVVILSACFNYTNLSIARALKRSKEVGIRKVIGAARRNVISQFIAEAVLVSVLSLGVALLLFGMLRPFFFGLNPELQTLFRLDLSFGLITWFLLFALAIGVGAGLFPALHFSRINAIQVLKGAPWAHAGKLTTRKALIIFQYCISLMLITGTVILSKQYTYFLNFDLGYTTENILNIEMQGNAADLLIKELNEIPEVNAISKSGIITSTGYFWSSRMKNPNNPEDSAAVRMNLIDEYYLTVHDHRLLAGRNFAFHPKGAPETEIIVNEQVLKRFNIASQIPGQAIGQMVRINGKDLMIIGVVKDFHYGRANNRGGDEVVFHYIDDAPQHVNVKFSSTDFPSFRDKVEAAWKKIDNVHPLQARLYADQIKESFRGLDASMKLAGFIAFLAIVIASLGMLGMVVFTTETRIKEVSIRKVLGASEPGLLFLLGKGFLGLLAMAGVIALPLTYLFFDQFLLPQLANHAPITLNEMTSGFMGVVLIALTLIGTQTIKIARTNPAAVLKNE